jgi:hypothetical protein
MKKIVTFILASLFISAVNAAPVLPNHATINFTLDHIEKGDSCPAFLQNTNVVINYEYNFERNMGLAYIKQIQATRWTEVLHPLGLSSMYAFMSDMSPKTVRLSGGEVVIYRVIFDLQFNGDSQATLMIGNNGDCIMSTNIINVNM